MTAFHSSDWVGTSWLTISDLWLVEDQLTGYQFWFGTSWMNNCTLFICEQDSIQAFVFVVLEIFTRYSFSVQGIYFVCQPIWYQTWRKKVHFAIESLFRGDVSNHKSNVTDVFSPPLYTFDISWIPQLCRLEIESKLAKFQHWFSFTLSKQTAWTEVKYLQSSFEPPAHFVVSQTTATAFVVSCVVTVCVHTAVAQIWFGWKSS